MRVGKVRSTLPRVVDEGREGPVDIAPGLSGGGCGTLNKIELHWPSPGDGADGEIVRPTSKDLISGVPAGTLYLQHAGGGGGRRPPTDVVPGTSVRCVEQWTSMFADIGLTEADMHRWHKLFERRHPEGHQGFLEWLQLPVERIVDIRRKSAEAS